MAITDIVVSGKLFQDDGDPVQGATVELFHTGTTTSPEATYSGGTTSAGLWSFTETDLDVTYDVRITSGNSKRFILWSDEIALKGVDTASLKVRGASNTAAAPIYLFADMATDAGDAWRIQATDSDTLAIGSDKAVKGTIIDYLTITNGANAAASVVAVGGDLTVGDDLSLTSDSAVLNMGAGNDFTITHDGTTGATIAGNPLTLDSGADIVLDAEGADVILKDGGTQYGSLTNSSSNLLIKSGSTTAATFSGANVTFAGTVDATTDFTIGSTVITDGVITDSSGLQLAANLDIDGNVQLDGTIIVGATTDGYDVKFWGNTSNTYMLWDESTDDLVLTLGAEIYFYDAGGGEHIKSDGTDMTIYAGTDLNLTAGTDINVPANVGLTFGNDAEKIEGDGTDLTISGNNINLTATADVVIPADVGITFGSGEKIEGDSTDLTVTSGAKINLTATSDVHIPKNVGIVFDDNASEKIESNNTDLTINSGADINLTATSDVNIPANVGITFGDDAEKIEGDGTDLTISGNNINLTAVADVNIPSGVGITFATAEKIESDGTDLSITVGSNGDINIPANIGMTFGDDGEKIEGDGTDLTIAGNNINLTATADVVIPADVGITFGSGEKIEGDNSDLTVTSGANIKLTAASDVVIPSGVGLILDGSGAEKIESDGTDISISVGSNGDINIPANIGMTFGNDGEKIEGDGTDLTIAGNIINLSGAVTASGLVSTEDKVVIGGTVDGTHHDQLRIKSPDTTLAVNQDYYALNVNPGGEITTPSSGENTNVGVANFSAAPISKTGGSSILHAFTVRIVNAPSAGETTNASLWVDSGMSLFDDGVNIGGTSTNNEIDDSAIGSGSTTLYIGNASITTSSDARLKTDIRPTEIDALELLDQMDVVDFGWDDPSDVTEYGRNYRGTYTGMVAQDTVKLAPWVINDQGGGRDCDDCMAGRECDQHGMFHVEYQHLVPTLVKAIQELKQELAEVRNGN